METTIELARDLNTHLAMYRHIYLPKIEADFPLTITIGVNGQEKIFNKGQEQDFFDWLAEAPEAAFMWRGCVDIIGLSNMFRMDIDCIVHLDGTEPQIHHFSPDPDFPFMDEDIMKPKDLTMRLQSKMTILNYKDNHFNLIIDKNSMLAVSGSLSFQRELAETAQDKTEERKSSSSNDTFNELTLKKKICELEITIEKVLKENKILRTKKLMESEHKNIQHDPEGFKCDDCGQMYRCKSSLESHITCHTRNTKFDPKDCSCAYPCITKEAPSEAIVETVHHKQQENDFQFAYQCRECRTGFSHKANLYKHKLTHKKDHQEHAPEVFSTNKGPINKHKNFQFSGLHACEKCGAVFLSEAMLEEHSAKYHQESPAIEIDEPGLNVETPTYNTILKTPQFHCALSSTPQSGTTECPFQCDTKGELDKHIKSNHNMKTQFQCSVCMVYFRDSDSLASHMNVAHLKESHAIQCNRCGKSIIDKTKLREHMNESHKTYKPCTKYQNNSCNKVPCRFEHIRLQTNQDICYKCGTTFMSKTDLINHIKKQHGNIVCHKYIQNQCDRSNDECIFSHSLEDVNRLTSSNKQQDFPQNSPTPLHSPITGGPNMSTHIQSQLRLQTPEETVPPQVYIINMIPQIVSQVIAALTMHLK